MIRKFKCEVTQITDVEVEINDEQIDEQFMSEFREYMYPFVTIDDHARHLAQLKARELIGSDGFVEGYGPLKDLNMSVKIVGHSVDVDSAPQPEPKP